MCQKEDVSKATLARVALPSPCPRLALAIGTKVLALIALTTPTSTAHAAAPTKTVANGKGQIRAVPAVEEQEGEPLQIVSAVGGDGVKANGENLDKICENLKNAGCERLSVVGVMGRFRTGKSFLLDQMIRFLESEGGSEAGRDGEEKTTPSAQPPRETGEAFQAPSWMLDDMGRRNDKKGFGWKGGDVGHTKGIYMWSKPFVREVEVTEQRPNPATGQMEDARRRVKCGVLLMDTQGAFDPQLDNKDACILGLSTALSSKLVYNIGGGVLGTDNMGNLDLFASQALRAWEKNKRQRLVLQEEGRSAGGDHAQQPFNAIEILVRDYKGLRCHILP